MAEIDDIRALVEVINAGGFGRAAKRLGVSKSIISRRIARLEGDLGGRLLSRTTRGFSPTEAGLEYKLRMEQILADLERAREAVAQQGGEVIGRVRVSLPLSFGIRHVAPVLATLALRHPRLEIEAAYSDRVVDLIGERFDAAVRIGQLKDSTLVARRIAPIRSVVVAAPSYLTRHGRPKVPGDLTAHECIIYNATPETQLWRFRMGRRWIPIRPEGRLGADNGEAIIAAALMGLGIALVPTFLAAPGIESGALEPLLTDYTAPEGGLFVVRPPGAQVSAKVRVLTDALVDRFGGEPDWDPCELHARSLAKAGKRVPAMVLDALDVEAAAV
jgi:DNA-binding transcriptional LysR family regulator